MITMKHLFFFISLLTYLLMIFKILTLFSVILYKTFYSINYYMSEYLNIFILSLNFSHEILKITLSLIKNINCFNNNHYILKKVTFFSLPKIQKNLRPIRGKLVKKVGYFNLIILSYYRS